MQKFRGVILDVDGTLVDSNDAHARAWAEAFAEAGHDVAASAVRPLIGMGGDKLVPALTGVAADSPEGERLRERHGEIFRARYLPGLKALPGARALVERLQAAGFKVVVGSSAKREELDPLLEVAGVADLIEQTTSSSDAENSKPEPGIVEAALSQLALPPEAVVMLGDTPYDEEAARRAGVALIAVESGGWKEAEFEAPIAVYTHPADLVERFEASPLAGDG